jgi:RNA 3'-terminal phosphate cyclase
VPVGEGVADLLGPATDVLVATVERAGVGGLVAGFGPRGAGEVHAASVTATPSRKARLTTLTTPSLTRGGRTSAEILSRHDAERELLVGAEAVVASRPVMGSGSA